MKVIYCLSHPIQYFAPLLAQMDKKMELEVLYYSDISVKGGMDKGFGTKVTWDLPLLEGYKYKFLKNWSNSQNMDCRFTDAINPGVFNSLRNSDANIVIVNGWAYATDWLVFLFAKILGKKVWVRTDTPLNQKNDAAKSFSGKIKKWVLSKILFKYFINKFLYIGEENKAYYLAEGVQQKDLIYTPFAVDNDRFQEYCKKNETLIDDFKKELNIPAAHRVILFSGKYIDKKRPMDLLKACKQLEAKDVTLVMMGEGKLRAEMEAFIATNNLKNVILTGFVNQLDVSKYYTLADIYVMCSGAGETWGLSVNEAMNFALPIVLSKTCGCSSDLVNHGVNGYVFEEGNIDELTVYLQKLLDDSVFRISAGEVSVQMINKYSIDNVVKNIVLAQ